MILSATAEEYMSKTKVYEEITDDRCPLADNLHGVKNLLKYFVTTDVLTIQRCNKLSQKFHNLELGYFHGLPKSHKIIILQWI